MNKGPTGGLIPPQRSHTPQILQRPNLRKTEAPPLFLYTQSFSAVQAGRTFVGTFIYCEKSFFPRTPGNTKNRDAVVFFPRRHGLWVIRSDEGLVDIYSLLSNGGPREVIDSALASSNTELLGTLTVCHHGIDSFCDVTLESFRVVFVVMD